MKDAVCQIAAWIYYSALMSLKEMGAAITAILAGSGSAGTIVSSATSTLNSTVKDVVIPAAQGVGLAISVTFFLIALIELMQNDRLTIELFIKFFSKLVISIALIFIAPEIFEAIISFGDALATMFANIGLTGTLSEWPTKDQLKETFLACANADKDSPNYMHWLTIFATSAFMAVPMNLVATILKGCCYVIAFTRMLEVAVRGSFLPVAFGLISDDGWRGAGGRYIRKFIAVCSQSAVLVVIAQLTEYVLSLGAQSFLGELLGETVIDGVSVTASPASMAGTMVLMIGIAVASVTMMFKSIGIINDVFGG